YLEESLSIAREIADGQRIASVLQPLVMVALGRGDTESARRYLHEALSMARVARRNAADDRRCRLAARRAKPDRGCGGARCAATAMAEDRTIFRNLRIECAEHGAASRSGGRGLSRATHRGGAKKSGRRRVCGDR